MSYRIYILPQEGEFCLGVFTGDTCISWSEYSARPSFVYHSTTLIFTPGNYTYRSSRYSGFRVANIKRLTVIGDEARLQFQLSFSNIGYVSMHNLTLVTNYPKIDVRDVQSFLMENCTLIRTQSSSSSSSLSYSLNLYRSKFNRIVESTFVQVPINAQTGSTLMVTGCSFSNSTTSCINGDSSSNITIHNSSFTNNYITNNYGVVTARSSLFVDRCLFDGNSGRRIAGVYATDDVSVINTIFTNNEASYRIYRYIRPVSYRYYRGGYAISGQRNIYIDNCTFSYYTFSYYTGSSSIIYSLSAPYNYYYYFTPPRYQVDIFNSRFYHSDRSVYSDNNVTITNSDFYNITARSGGGGALWSQGNITLTNTNITNSVSQSGSGGAVYGLEKVTTVNCSIHGANVDVGNGGAIYSGKDVMIINSTLSQCSVQNGTGGAIYSEAKSPNNVFNRHSTVPNIVISGSTFSYNSATKGGVLYTNDHYNHHMEFKNSTFVFNEATDSGGVAFLGNTSLSISNCVFNNNTAGTDAGVLDVAFSSVIVKQSALSHNRADNNGGVFYGRNYTTNFTIVQTLVEDNTATNGGVFHVRRSDSNIKVVDSTFIENYATNKGGVMDIGGVTLTMDSDTVITNNLADISGNVISSCLSQITAYGLEVQPNSVYPMYCSLYNEGNRSHAHNIYTSDPISTTEELSATTVPVDKEDTEGTTSIEEDTTSLSDATSASIIPTSNTPPFSTTTSTSDGSKGRLVAHTSTSATTSVSDGITSVPQWINGATTNSDENTSTQANTITTSTSSTVSTGLDPGQQPWTDDLTTVQERVTEVSTQGSTGSVPTTVPTLSTSTSIYNEQTTTGEHLGHPTTDYQHQTETETQHTREPVNTDSSEKTTQISHNDFTESDAKVLTTEQFSVDPELQANKDIYDTWNSSEHDILQVAIVSLAILCTICIVVCVMAFVLFFIACKRRNITLRPRGNYKKLPLTDKEQEATEDEIQEYSFMEI